MGTERPAVTHRGHAHVHSPATADRGRLIVALLLILGFMAAEVVVGIVSHSLALLSDAGHMLTDAAAIGLGLVAMRLAASAPGGSFTYGLKRAEIMAAMINGVTLAVLVVWILIEAVSRLIQPLPVHGRAMLLTALAGIGVNLLATWQLAQADRESLNIRGIFSHVATDLVAFVGTALAGAVILLTGFTRADPIASIIVAGLMAYAAYGLMRDAGRSLLEGAPEGIDPALVGATLVGHPHVASVHDLHVWQITSGFPALSAHVLVHPGDDCHAIRRDLEALVHERFDIEHTTLQVDHENDPFVHFTAHPLRPDSPR